MLRRGIVGLCVLVATAGLSAAPAFASTLTVTNSNDAGAGSLRNEIHAASPGDTIAFQDPLSTITLTSGPITINEDLTINGTGSPVITSSLDTGVFAVTSGNVTFDGIAVEGLDSTVPGGAIYVDDASTTDTVTVNDSTFEHDDDSGSDGAAIADLGASVINISGSTFTNDETDTGDGGAIYLDTANAAIGVTGVISSSTFDDDSAADGGAIYDADASGGNALEVRNSTFEDDQATTGYGGAVDNAGGTDLGEVLFAKSVFLADSAQVDGGAIANGAGATEAVTTVQGSEFSGNEAVTGSGAGLYDDASVGADSYVVHSTFVGDILGSRNAASGFAIYASGGQPFEVTSNLFVEGCGGMFMSTGYNVAMPATAGGTACAQSATDDQVTPAAGEVVHSTQNSQLLEPVSPNPAIDLIPDNATARVGTTTASMCPVTDLLGNEGPDSTGNCSAGAIQVQGTVSSGGGGSGSGGSGSGGGSGTGGTGGGSGTTTTPPSSTPKKTITTVVKFDNQQITLISPSLNVCTASGKTLTSTLTSKKIKHSRKPKLSFKLATFTAGGKDKHTAKRLTAKVSIKLKGLKAHSTDKLKVAVAYRMPRKHKKPKTVSKTITVKFKVC
jgi:hypothetical protein